MPHEAAARDTPEPSPSGGAEGSDPPGPSPSVFRRLAARLLRIPLFYKILLANAAAVALAAGLGAWLAAAHGLGRSGQPSPLASALLLATVAGLTSAGIHVFLLRRALAPLRELADVASRLQDRGADDTLRARIPATADSNLADLIRVFNGMLDTMAAYRSQLRRLTARTLEAAEEERKLVADRLHQDVAQRLAALLVGLRVVRRSRDPDRREEALERLREEAALALESVRRTARSLHPPELADLGLEGALRAFVRRMEDEGRAGEARVELELDPLDDDFGEARRIALYRILREALHNAWSHAEATLVRVEVRRDGDRLRATVRDDGRGFEGHGPGTSEQGLGLLAMRELAIHAGGDLDIHSRSGRGTSVLVDLPVSRRSDPGATGDRPPPGG